MAGLERRAGLGHTTVSRALNGLKLPSEATVTALAQALDEGPGLLLELHRKAAPQTVSSKSWRTLGT